jgi:hypothetical protein
MTSPASIPEEGLRELLAAAGKETPGEWGEGDKWVFVSPRSGNPSEALEHIFRNEEAQANAAFVALANPATVTALVTELLAARAISVDDDELPAHPEDFDYAALLISHDRKRTKWVVVPEGQSLDFDEGTATRRWLHPHLGSEWHLFDFVRLRSARALSRPSVSVDEVSALSDIASERRRQVEVEGWTPEHDDAHSKGELAQAAGVYALAAGSHDYRWVLRGSPVNDYLAAAMKLWPWDASWFKPKDKRRDLVKAGALIVAEIERLDRAALASRQTKLGEP